MNIDITLNKKESVKMIKISVLMPIYNTNEEHLREAINSILEQTYENFEFLIINDSPNNTKLDQIINSYNDKRIVYVKNKHNMGISPSRNKLLQMSKGEYIAVMDHDDISSPERFAKQVDFLDKNKEYGVVGCNITFIPKNKTKIYPENDNDIKLALMKGCAVTHPSAMIRKQVLTDNNICYEEFFTPSEDYALWCRLIAHTKFYIIQEPLFVYRKHPKNTSGIFTKKRKEATNALRYLVRHKHPDIYGLFLQKARFNRVYRLFGIPILKIVSQGWRFEAYLFGVILILSYKKYARIKFN